MEMCKNRAKVFERGWKKEPEILYSAALGYVLFLAESSVVMGCKEPSRCLFLSSCVLE